MNTAAAIVQIYEDPAAVRVGQVYRRGKEAYQEAGRLLTAEKARRGHGQWLPWLAANETVLGFGQETARLLMRWADNPSMSAEEAWGNEARNSKSDLEFEPAPFTSTRRDVGISPEPQALDMPEIVEPKNTDDGASEPDTILPILEDAILSILREKAAGLTRDQVRQLCDGIARRWRSRRATKE